MSVEPQDRLQQRGIITGGQGSVATPTLAAQRPEAAESPHNFVVAPQPAEQAPLFLHTVLTKIRCWCVDVS
jgi:hypothetical protein